MIPFQRMLKHFCVECVIAQEHTSRHWTSIVYNSNRSCNDKPYVGSSKTRQIALGGSGGKCNLYTKPMFDEGLVLCHV